MEIFNNVERDKQRDCNSCKVSGTSMPLRGMQHNKYLPGHLLRSLWSCAEKEV